MLALVFPIGDVRAEGTTMEIIMKDSFRVGEKISFNYSIMPETTAEITFQAYIDCPTAPIPLLEQRTIMLQAGQLYTDTYLGTIIEEFIEPQTCTAYVEILEPFYQKVEKEFKIETKPSFEIRILSCKDEACAEESKVFVQGERTYFNYISEVAELEVSGKLTAPDGKVEELTLPADLILDQVGKYILETEAQKEGYKTSVQTLELVVLEEEPRIIDRRICNANGICEPDRGETIQSCPQDCLLPEALLIKETIEKKAAEAKKRLYFILGGIGILIAIGAAIYFYLREKWFSWPEFKK